MINRLPRWIWLGGFLLSACAGLTNTLAVMGFSHHAISYVTGMISSTAISLARLHWTQVLASGSIVLAFFLGSVISGFIVKNESLCTSRSYGIALILESLFLMVACWGLNNEWWLGEWMAAMACGLQNALVTTYSGSIIRTTHLTGITSDLGASLGNLLAGKPTNKKKVAIQCVLFLGFSIGSLLGVGAYAYWGVVAILLPACIVLLCGVTYTVFIKNKYLSPSLKHS